MERSDGRGEEKKKKKKKKGMCKRPTEPVAESRVFGDEPAATEISPLSLHDALPIFVPIGVALDSLRLDCDDVDSKAEDVSVDIQEIVAAFDLQLESESPNRELEGDPLVESIPARKK